MAPSTSLAGEPDESAPSLIMETVYFPVLARHQASLDSPYVCPAIKVTPGRRGEDYALFPLSSFELGEVWTTREELRMWELIPVDGGWSRAELAFLPLVTYPPALLRVLLDVFRHQSYVDGSPLGWTSWQAACRRPSRLMSVPMVCSRCQLPRLFAPRALLNAPKALAEWHCQGIGLQCDQTAPENVFDVRPEQWYSFGRLASVVGQSLAPQRSIELRTLQGDGSIVSASRPRGYAANSGISVVKRESRPPVENVLHVVKQERVTVKEEVVKPEDSVSNIGNPPVADSMNVRHPNEMNVTSFYGWNDRPHADVSNDLVQAEMRHVIGTTLHRMTAKDPSQEDMSEWQRWMLSGKSEQIKKTFVKWAESHREVFFEAKNDVGVFVEWKETLEYYFSTAPIVNECCQAWLATSTFKKTAMRWWGVKARRWPRLLLTYQQLLEWLQTELIPSASQDEALTAWQLLAFRGTVDDYVKQLDRLTLCYPLSHSLTIAQATHPLGEECKAGVKRLDMQFGLTGMPYRQLRQYIELYLKERTPAELRSLAERSMGRGGFGKPPSTKDRPLIAASSTSASSSKAVAGSLHAFEAVDDDVDSREVVRARDRSPERPRREARRASSPRYWGGRQGRADETRSRPARRYGQGKTPCWVCGEPGHRYGDCPRRKKNVQCGVCGSDAHPPPICPQRYYPNWKWDDRRSERSEKERSPRERQ